MRYRRGYSAGSRNVSELPPPPESVTMTPQDELTIALRDHLHSELASAPKGKLTWVMSAEWLKECRKLDDSRGRVFWPLGEIPDYRVMAILGIPVEVRDDAGVPQLVPDDQPG